jgi:hypothetical protein
MLNKVEGRLIGHLLLPLLFALHEKMTVLRKGN